MNADALILMLDTLAGRALRDSHRSRAEYEAARDAFVRSLAEPPGQEPEPEPGYNGPLDPHANGDNGE